jgi:protein-L-isoaspartate O-methyltransferase
MVDLEPLRALLDRDDGRDRAFVDAMIRMSWSRTRDPAQHAALGELHVAVRAASHRSHAALRARIATGALRGAALKEHFDGIPELERDHFVEEALGIAYPPLEEPDPETELIAYAPSGYGEILHAFEVTRLGPGDRFLDLGSGTGKAVILAALLAGATSSGIECDGALHALAEAASRGLGLESARFTLGDARTVALEDADVVYMYLPFTGTALATVMSRLTEQRQRSPPGSRARARFLCAGALDLNRYPELVAAGPAKSWLQVYAWR